MHLALAYENPRMVRFLYAIHALEPEAGTQGFQHQKDKRIIQ